MPSEPRDPQLYAKVKIQIYAKMPVHSAYRSSHLVKRYKAEYKKKHGSSTSAYSGTSKKMNRNSGLTRWHREQWRSDTGEVGYRDRSSVYRPTKRITKETPKTFGELSLGDIQRAKREKEKTGRVLKFGHSRRNVDGSLKSAPTETMTAKKSGWKPIFSVSDRRGKKYSVVTPLGKKIHFGDANSEQWKDSTGLGEFTHKNHNDPERRRRYLLRAGGIRNRAGKLTKDDPEYANYYSIRYLW